MLHEEWRKSSRHGYELYVQQWMPEAKPIKAIVCLAHGSGEHSSRYLNVAKEMTGNGFSVIAFDHYGHGRSEGKRGHFLSLEAALTDTASIIEEAGSKFPGVPIFLYGHSMGGNIALNCALRLQPPIKGLIATSPWLELAFKPPGFKMWLGKKLVKLLPEMHQSTGLKAEDLYRPGNQNAITMVGDPLSHTKITLKAFIEIEEGGQWALQHASQLNVPFLLMHGNADRITSYAASNKLAGQLGERCHFITLEGGYHELHHDIEGQKTIEQIILWMNRQL